MKLRVIQTKSEVPAYRIQYSFWYSLTWRNLSTYTYDDEDEAVKKAEAYLHILKNNKLLKVVWRSHGY